jgi:NitT/TauT family transport system substrate-binding protein
MGLFQQPVFNVDTTTVNSIPSPQELVRLAHGKIEEGKFGDGRFFMKRFRIEPHGRLQEWVAEEKGYFKDEGLDYEFLTSYATQSSGYALVQSTETAAPEVKRGAFENMERGRAADISCACHWAVNMASSAGHGRMWGHAYSVTPSAIVVAPESSIRKPRELAGIEVGVGYHSGSYFSAIQALEKVLKPDEIKLRFIGQPQDRLAALLDRKVDAANMFGALLYVAEQQGFRKILDTTFMIGFLLHKDADVEDVKRYFKALQRAQRDIDLEPEQYKHYFLKELPEKYYDKIDVSGFGPGERLVFEPYTREMFERTQRWMDEWKLFPEGQTGTAEYGLAVSVHA